MTTHPASPVVRPAALVIGGSAGGFEAITRLLSGLPAGFELPVITIIHLPRNRRSSLAEAIASRCRLPVREAEDKQPISPGTVHVAAPDYHLMVDPGPVLAMSIDEPVNYSIPSIDVLFESAADVYGERLIGVIVSGANSDGAAGVEAIQRAGGRVFIQSPDEASSPDMPLAAISRCPSAGVLTMDQIRDEVLRLCQAPAAAVTKTPAQ